MDRVVTPVVDVVDKTIEKVVDPGAVAQKRNGVIDFLIFGGLLGSIIVLMFRVNHLEDLVHKTNHMVMEAQTAKKKSKPAPEDDSDDDEPPKQKRERASPSPSLAPAPATQPPPPSPSLAPAPAPATQPPPPTQLPAPMQLPPHDSEEEAEEDTVVMEDNSDNESESAP